MLIDALRLCLAIAAAALGTVVVASLMVLTVRALGDPTFLMRYLIW
jgi:hypothetical protein